jgi:hypothetical protein
MHKHSRAILSLAFCLWATAALAQGLDIGLGLDNVRNQNWVLSGAGLDFDFTSSRFYQAGQTVGNVSLVTTSRASTKYCDDTLGNWPQANNNVLCLTDKGASIEEARTNSIRNNSMQGVVAGVVGSGGSVGTNWSAPSSGMTATVSGPFTENGIDYIRINVAGTATGNTFLAFETTTQIAATYGQTWANSHFFRQFSGTFPTVSTELRSITGAGVFISDSSTAFTPAAASTPLGQARVSASFTPTNSTVGFVRPGILFGTVNLSVYNFTFDIGWPQLENNSINSTVASATMATGGATCTNGTQLFTVSGGTGTAATLTGTVVANAIQAGALTVTTPGSYTVFPPSPATVTGGGCGTPPTVNLVPTDNSAQGVATSPIRTTAAAATRAADVLVPTNSPTFGSAYTLFAKGTPNAPSGSPNNQSIVTASDNTANNRIGTFRNNTSAAANSFDVVGGAAQTAPSSAGTWSQSASGKLIAAFASNDIAVDFNGAAVVTSAANTLPASLTRLEIGSNGISGGQWNGYIERIALWPTTRIPNATLQSLTQ